MLCEYKITVNFQGEEYTFPVQIERKKRKQLVLRVYPKTRRVLFSLPGNTPDSYAREFLQSRRAWLEKQLLGILSLPPAHEYKTGELFYCLGQALTLTARPGMVNRAALSDGRLILDYKEPLDKAACRKAIERLFAQLARPAAEAALSRMLKVYKAIIPIDDPPALKLRRMSSRWGVCWPRRRQICLSTRLAHVAPALIDYVAAHELCHLKFCDHSPVFWQLLEQGLPGWRDCRRELARINTLIDI